MPLQFSPLFLIAIALAVVALAASLYIWRVRDTYGSIPLLLLALVAADWSLCLRAGSRQHGPGFQTLLGQSAVARVDASARVVAGDSRAWHQ